MLTDYCWCLKRDIPVQPRKRKALKRLFVFRSLFVNMHLYINQLLNFIEKVMHFEWTYSILDGCFIINS